MTDKSSSLYRHPARWLLGAVLAIGSSLVMAQPLTPFTASYSADMKNIPVNGRATHSLQQNTDGTWALKFHASMFVASLTEESTLTLDGDQVQPLTYHYQRKGLGRGRETTQTFDWATGEVRGVHKKEAFTLPAHPGLLDKTTYQIALQRDLMAGKTEMTYLVVDGDDLDEYQFRVTGEDRVTTRNGQFNAVEVERIREPDAKRETTLWFAKDWNYLLVRLSQIETDGEHYQIVLKDATMDGQPVTGQPIQGH